MADVLRASIALATCTTALLGSSPAHAEEPIAVPAAHANAVPWHSPSSARWRGGVMFDDVARAALHAPDTRGESIANTISNGTLYTMIAAPYVASLGYTLERGGNAALGGELALIDTAAFGVTFGTMLAIKLTVARERPYATAGGLTTHCAEPRFAHDVACLGDRNESFLSGHSAASFTGASLVCAQAAYIGGGGWLNGTLCGAAMATASTTAMLRIVADRHYASDTIAGALLGIGAGFALPTLLSFMDTAPLPVGRELRTGTQRPDTLPVFAGAAIGTVVGVAAPLVASTIAHAIHRDRLAIAQHGPAHHQLTFVPSSPAPHAAGIGVGMVF